MSDNGNDENTCQSANTQDLTEHERGESILMALDQLGQTIDVMNSVVGRLRQQIEEYGSVRDAELRQAMSPDRILH